MAPLFLYLSPHARRSIAWRAIMRRHARSDRAASHRARSPSSIRIMLAMLSAIEPLKAFGTADQFSFFVFGFACEGSWMNEPSA